MICFKAASKPGYREPTLAHKRGCQGRDTVYQFDLWTNGQWEYGGVGRQVRVKYCPQCGVKLKQA